MHEPDERIEDEDLADLERPHGEQVADEHRADLLGAVRRAIGQQDGRRRGHRVDDADHRLLRDVTPAAPRDREHEGAEQGGRETVRVRFPLLDLVPLQECRGRTEGGDLRHRDVHEHDLAGEHVDTEIGVDPREHQAHEERSPEDREQVEDHAQLS